MPGTARLLGGGNGGAAGMIAFGGNAGGPVLREGGGGGTAPLGAGAGGTGFRIGGSGGPVLLIGVPGCLGGGAGPGCAGALGTDRGVLSAGEELFANFPASRGGGGTLNGLNAGFAGDGSSSAAESGGVGGCGVLAAGRLGAGGAGAGPRLELDVAPVSCGVIG